MHSIKLVLKGEPMAKQSVRQGKNRQGATVFYQPEKYKFLEQMYRIQIKKQLPKDFVMFSEFVRVESCIIIQSPTKAMLKHKAQSKWLSIGGLIPKPSRPDVIDNLNKLPFDAMSKLVYSDDGIIYDVNSLSKFYGLNPRIEIELIGV